MPDVPLAPDEAAALHAANARLRQVIGAKDSEIAVLREQVEALTAQVAELRARLGNNSRNSSKPPSAEGLAKPAPRSLRKKTGRKPGRPKGQPGVTLELTDHPDELVTHEPGSCAGCGNGLSGAGVTATERRQVIDLPDDIRAVVTEHRLVSRRCGCGTVTSGTAPAGVTAPVRYGPRLAAACAYLWHGQFLPRGRTCEAAGDLFGVPVSPGAVAGMVNRIAGKLGAPLGGHPQGADHGRCRPLRRDRVPGGREAGLGALGVVGEVRAPHRARQTGPGRHGRRRGAPGVPRDRGA